MAGNASLPNNMVPIASECVAADLPIQGELPRALNGTLFRNGPNPQFPVASQHWFTGDGMVHAFTLSDGHASYRNAWVRTANWRCCTCRGCRREPASSLSLWLWSAR